MTGVSPLAIRRCGNRLAPTRLYDPIHDGLEWARFAHAIDREDAGIRYNIACLYALKGRRDEAIECLEECVRLGFGNAEWIGKDPDLASLHGDERYEALLERMTMRGREAHR
jgi:tetratricopeptide (TPR) repeat protein